MGINEMAAQRNMALYGPFAATERVLMALVKAGAGRQEGHEWLRGWSLEAWQSVQDGEENPLRRLLEGDERITRYLSTAQIRDLMDSTTYTGTANVRAKAFAQHLREKLAESI